jgi:hypothetical protein
MKAKNVLRAMLVMALLAAVFAVPASADKPESYTYTYEEDVTSTGCGFETPGHLEGKVKYSMWFDKDGNAYGDSYKLSEYHTYSYNGHEVTFHTEGIVRFTWISDDGYEMKNYVEFGGIISHATIPGHGLVRASAGRVTYTETCHEEGEEWVCENEIHHPWAVDFVDSETICNYLLTGE